VHGALSLVAAALYALFVIPRWWELTGDTSHVLGNILRIVTGVLIGLAALPVVFTLLRTRNPELGTPRLALSLRLWSIVAHVLSGVLIIGAAISEFWLSLDVAGPYLFAIYGAAAAIAILGIEAFHLSFVAEAPPKPVLEAIETEPDEVKPDEEKPDGEPEADSAEAKKSRWRFLRRPKGATADQGETGEERTGAAPAETAPTAEIAPTVEAETEEAVVVAEVADTQADEPQADEPQAVDSTGGGLLNRRPTGKGSHRMRRQRTPSDAATDQ